MSNIHELFLETQEYERKRNEPQLCRLTWVQATNAIVFNGVAHAGVATHICSLPKLHKGECVCECHARSLQK